MKKIKVQIILMLTFLSLISCSKQSTSPKDGMINLLTSSAWVVESVTNQPDGDVTFEYTNFSISFERKSSGNYIGSYYLNNGSMHFQMHQVSGRFRTI
ncbi:MAG: hypothetical protein QM734_07495 [Cyclobacteriaceae bacterium]